MRNGRLCLTAMLLTASGAAHAATTGPGEDAAPALQHRAAAYDGLVAVRVTPGSVRQLNGALAVADVVVNCRVGIGLPIDLAASPRGIDALRRMGMDPIVLHEDLGKQVREEQERIELTAMQRGVNWYATYHDLAGINQRIDEVAAANAQVVTLGVAGQSIEGRDLRTVSITGPGPGAAGRPTIMFTGGQHAREWVSPATMTYFIETLAEGYGSDPRITALLDTARVVIVPIVNPDGYEYSWTSERYWRKNRRNNGDGTRGVDLNRNWSFLWGGPGSSGTTSEDIYRGPTPFSEPETSAVRDLANAELNLVAHIDWHSYSQLILYPYGGQVAGPRPDDVAFFETTSQDMSDDILNNTGVYYDPIAGYELYLAAGDCGDWFYGEREVYSWTYEMRPGPGNGLSGFALDQAQILPTAQECFSAAMLMMERTTLPVRLGFLDRASVAPGTAPYEVRVLAESGIQILDSSSVTLRVRNGDTGPFQSLPMAAQGGGVYTAMIPAAQCGTAAQYYVEASSTTGDTAELGSAALPESVLFLEYNELARDGMETDTGWTVGAPADSAFTGVWERAEPQATAAQPGADASPNGALCWITQADAGTGLGSFDIDGGATTLFSPVYDLTGAQDALIEYTLWYSNNQGSAVDDELKVQLSNDGITWTDLEVLTGSTSGWETRSFVVSDFLSIADMLQMRVIADDSGGGSIVEAGLDDFVLTLIGCAPTNSATDLTTTGSNPGDAEYGQADGIVDVADLTYLVEAWVGEQPVADRTTSSTNPGDAGYGVPDGVVDVSDLSYFVEAWVAETGG
ncbi:MAG: M14 family zinc carboxypeptidase [Planctomycetota bacterium]